MSKPRIDLIDSDKFSKTYYMHQDLSGLDLYERTKAIERFANNATKTLETLISSDIRDFLRGFGIIPQDGSESALHEAFLKLKIKGFVVEIRDNYLNLYDEHIICESPNMMTIVLENKNLIGCSISVEVKQYE